MELNDSFGPGGEQLRIAFDGDAVLFSDEAEQVFQAEGLEAFARTEKQHADTPLPGGPLKPFLQALQLLSPETNRKVSQLHILLRCHKQPILPFSGKLR